MLLILFLPGNEITTPQVSLPHIDKLIHFGGFLILAGLAFKTIAVYLPLRSAGSTTLDITQRCLSGYLIATILLLLFAGLSEIIQAKWIVGRSGDIGDFIADSIGIMGAFLGRFLSLERAEKKR